MSDTITIPKGDYGFNLDFTCTDKDGNAFDLTSYTIKFKVWEEHKPTRLLVDGTCTIDVAADGTCHYTVVSGDFDTVGSFKYEVEAFVTDTKYESFESGDLEVVESG